MWLCVHGCVSVTADYISLLLLPEDCMVYKCWCYLQLGLDNPKINAMFVMLGKVEGSFNLFYMF